MAQTYIKYFNGPSVTFDSITIPFEVSVPNKILDVTLNNISDSSVDITWSTETKSKIDTVTFLNGACPPVGCKVVKGNVNSSAHLVSLTKLLPDTIYTFTVTSETSGGDAEESDQVVFRTLKGAVTPIVVDQNDYTVPKILSEIKTTYDWNTEKDATLTFTFEVNKETKYVKYYFPSQPNTGPDGDVKVIPQGNQVTIQLQNPNGVGVFDFAVLPTNDIVGDGIVTQVKINVFRERSYGEPDITNIEYYKDITEADLRPLDFNFDFKLDSVNSEGIDIFLGSDVTTPIISTDVVSNSTHIQFYAKDLYNRYRNSFNETADTYTLTFSLHPFFNGIGGKIYGKLEVVTVSVTKTKFTISDSDAADAFTAAFTKLFSGGDTRKDYEDKIVFDNEKHLYYRIKYAPFDAFVITNIAEDDLTYSIDDGGKVVLTKFIVDPTNGNTVREFPTPYKTLVVKLLEPIPATVTENSQVWISKQIIPTVIEDIIITATDSNECIPLSPNFNADVLDETGYQYFNDIVASGSITSTDIVNRYVSQSGFDLSDLNILYTSGSDVTSNSFVQFGNFVNFSSAEARVGNYQYKLQAIEFWKSKITSTLYSGSSASTASYSLITSQSYANSITTIKNGFDAFEKTLYNDFSVTTSGNTFFSYQLDTANTYDRENKNYLIRHLPEYLTTDAASEDFTVFIKMIGQHFDVLWSYINGIRRTKVINNISTDGISDDLVHTLLEGLGWDPKYPFKGYELWKEAFGTNADGTTTANRNTNGTNVISSYTPEQARTQVWRRLLNNLPYLLKHKGTRRSINAIMACYGVPSSLLTIMEFGGPSQTPTDLQKFTYEDRSAALKLATTEYVTLPWNAASTPNSVEVKFKTTYTVPTATSISGSQLLRESIGNTYWRVNVIPASTGSYGTVKFEMSGSQRTFTSPISFTDTPTKVSMQITGSVIFDGDYKFLTIQRERFTSGALSLPYDRFTMYMKEAVDDRIIMNQSASLVLQASSSAGNTTGNIYYTSLPWLSTGTLFIGSDNSGSSGISGSIDDFRIWNTALSESVVTSHTLNSDVIYGNNIYSSTNDLLVRLDFEYPKNRVSASGDPYIKNVAPATVFTTTTGSGGTYTISSGYIGYATASVTTTATTYPYQYDVYDRTLTAEIPAFGFVGGDKVRTEEIELISNLSYRSRSTKKAYDRAPIDSNRLGLFFSPVKELNMDILRSLGPINIGDYIGDFADEYGSDNYGELSSLRNYYFNRVNLDFSQYIRLVKSIDKSLFDMLDQVIPERAHTVKGLLIEPSILERSKIEINRPEGAQIFYTASTISITDNVVVESETTVVEGVLDSNFNKDLEAGTDFYTSSIHFNSILQLSSDAPFYTGSYKLSNDLVITGTDIYSIGSNGGCLDAIIDSGYADATVLGEYDLETSYETAGNDADSPYVSGFGIVGQNGAVDRTYRRSDGTLVLTERNNAYILTIKHTRKVPSTNYSGVTTYEVVAKYSKKLIIISPLVVGVFQTPTAHSFYTGISAALGTFPYDNGVVTGIVLFDGYTTGHYRYTKDTTRGRENSFFYGAKQTSRTTLDGSPAVETFATNPNKLKVNATGRGAGEPILIAT